MIEGDKVNLLLVMGGCQEPVRLPIQGGCDQAKAQGCKQCTGWSDGLDGFWEIHGEGIYKTIKTVVNKIYKNIGKLLFDDPR
jgi:hypothetical protein